MRRTIINHGRRTVSVTTLKRTFSRSRRFIGHLVYHLGSKILHFQNFTYHVSSIVMSMSSFFPDEGAFRFQCFRNGRFVVGGYYQAEVPLLRRFFPLDHQYAKLTIRRSLKHVVPNRFRHVIERRLNRPRRNGEQRQHRTSFLLS